MVDRIETHIWQQLHPHPVIAPYGTTPSGPRPLDTIPKPARHLVAYHHVQREPDHTLMYNDVTCLCGDSWPWITDTDLTAHLHQP